MQRPIRYAIVTVIAIMLLGTSAEVSAQTVVAAPSVDLNRFTGTWYEIARLPNKREKKCIADVIEILALGDKANGLQIVGSCKTNKGYTEVRNATAKAIKGSGDSKLKVTYLWPFSEKRWILAIGPNYEWALVGTPNHKMLWVVSRERTMEGELLSSIKQKAVVQGFPVEKLKTTAQSGS